MMLASPYTEPVELNAMVLNAVARIASSSVKGGDSVLLKILPGMVQAEANVGIGSEVEDRITALHRGGERVEVEIIAANELEVRVLARAFHESFLAGERLSQPATRLPAARSRSARLLPIKPAAPVMKMVCKVQLTGLPSGNHGFRGFCAVKQVVFDRELSEQRGLRTSWIY